jgi:hypothetical protein
MQTITQPHIAEHRLARFVTWGQAMLAWLATMLFTETLLPRHRQRFSMLTLMPRFVECLLVLRASRVLRRARRAHTRPANTPAGFTRSSPTRGQTLRAAIGANLRRRLRPHDLAARFAIWFEALANLDAFAAPLVRRAKRRLTRLCALIPTRPPHDNAAAFNAPNAPHPTDTS